MILLYFILGILFIDFIVPIYEKTAEWIICRVQLSISAMQVSAAYMQHEVENIGEKEQQTRAIGFSVDDDNEYEDDE